MEQTYEACYGITHDDFLSLQCGTNEILYVYDVYTYAKQLSTSSTYGCVHIRQSATYNSTECCHYVNDTEDCGMRYYGSYFVHYCVGINTCTNQVAWNSTLNVCDQTVYFSETHYMKAFYNCIPSSNILDICSSDSTQGNPVYIWNTNYPGKQGDCSSNSGCSCRASSSSSGMKVNVLDLRLYNYVTGDCQQQLHITDGSTEFVISCTAYHAFKRTTVYTSTTSQIQLRFDNVFQYGYGNLWIEIESTYFV
ncbi:hypothetical protein KUTeg_007897 [Tegillarca granosa]|uniref:Uncharacterized protein n=1 Tax=Tegillarca granosa TaxID=220873 RepID=A0ABQ9FIJ0_TEGGR|nr:hypothetical protein KUTeg_007897 [Tegillarca granosa]